MAIFEVCQGRCDLDIMLDDLCLSVGPNQKILTDAFVLWSHFINYLLILFFFFYSVSSCCSRMLDWEVFKDSLFLVRLCVSLLSDISLIRCVCLEEGWGGVLSII